MKLRFKKTEAMEKYQGFHGKERIDFSDGQTKNVPDEKAAQLLKDFPEFFTRVKESKEDKKEKGKVIENPPRDKMLRGKDMKKK